MASAVVLGLIGGLQAIKPDIAPALKEDSTGSIGGRTTGRVRAALAAVQITVSLLLLIGAALFTRSVRSAGAIGLGFEPRGVVALDVGAVGGRTSGQTLAVLEGVVRKAATLPDVQAAAVSTRAPLDSSTPLARVNPREAVVSGDRTSPTVGDRLVEWAVITCSIVMAAAHASILEVQLEDLTYALGFRFVHLQSVTRSPEPPPPRA